MFGDVRIPEPTRLSSSANLETDLTLPSPAKEAVLTPWVSEYITKIPHPKKSYYRLGIGSAGN